MLLNAIRQDLCYRCEGRVQVELGVPRQIFLEVSMRALFLIAVLVSFSQFCFAANHAEEGQEVEEQAEKAPQGRHVAPPDEFSLQNCDLTEEEQKLVLGSFRTFSEFKQKPFTDYDIETTTNGKRSVRFPERELEEKRSELLAPVVELVLKKQKCAVKVLSRFEKVLLDERGGKELERHWINLGETDNHNRMAHLILGAREILTSRETGVPSLSMLRRFYLTGFDRGLRGPVFNDEKGVYVFESTENRDIEDPKKKKYYIYPDAEIVTNEKLEDGSRVIKMRFPDFSERAKEYAKKWSTEKEDDAAGWREDAAKALTGQWHTIDIDKVEIYEKSGFGAAEGKTLAKAEREVDPKYGIVYSLKLSPEAARRNYTFDAGDRTGKGYDVRSRAVMYLDGHLDSGPTYTGRIEFDVKKR